MYHTKVKEEGISILRVKGEQVDSELCFANKCLNLIISYFVGHVLKTDDFTYVYYLCVIEYVR